MNLYLLTQGINNGYDTYDSAVVAAESEEEARRVSPCHFYVWREVGGWHFKYADGREKPEGRNRYDWTSPDQVTAELIGVASEGTAAGVICASFNAG
jgi:hypothetical protein